jgi:hypothetical protein
MRLVGKNVEVNFWDHCEGGAECVTPMRTMVWGRCVQEQKDYLVIRSWHSVDADAAPDSHQQWVIVRSTIMEVKVLT